MLVSAPFGFRPVLHPAGQSRANAYTIASAYGSQISYGDPVMLNTNGTITLPTATTDPILGIFAGCEYIDATGKPTESKHWPAGITATNIVAYVYDDPFNQYDVQYTANQTGAVQTALGDQVNAHPVTAGSAVTGQSNASLALAPVGAASQGQFRIVGFSDGIYDSTNNPYPVVRVQIARHTFMSPQTAI